MKKIQFAISALVVAFCLCTGYLYAQSLYGENCNGCGIGNDIVTGSIHCYVLNNNDVNDTSIPCKTSLSAYGVLPSTANPEKMVFKFHTNHSSYGAVFAGGVLNVTDRQYDGEGLSHTPTFTQDHTVVAEHLVPAGGNGGAYTFYLGACQNAFPCSQADPTWSSYPGPTGSNQGRGHLFSIYPPAATPYLPVTFDINPLGHKTAKQGYPAYIPVLSIQKTGQFTTLPASGSLNQIALKGTSPNGGVWSVWTGSAWVTTAPAWYLTTLEIIDGSGNHYICHPDAQGNHTQNTGVVENTCKTAGGTDFHAALVVFYPGQFGQMSSDLRSIQFDAGTNQYFVRVADTTAPAGNPQANLIFEVFPGTNSLTGAVTAHFGGTLYTDQSSHTPVSPSTTFDFSIPITISAPTVVAPNPPSSFAADANTVPDLQFAAQSAINMCANNSTYAIFWWANTQHTWVYGPIADSTFGEAYPWNYDPARVYHGAKDHFTHKMDGTPWPGWAASHSYGGSYNELMITPVNNNPNHYTFMATNTGASNSGSEPGWSTHSGFGSTFVDGAETWRNVGNSASWETCINQGQNPYVNASINAGLSANDQATQFEGGVYRSWDQTGDAYPQDGGQLNGIYGRFLIDSACYNSGTTECAPDHGAASTLGASPWNPYSQSAARGQAKALMAMSTYWRMQARLGTAGNFTNDVRRKAYARLYQNALIDFFDYVSHQSNVGTVDPLDNWYVANDPFMFGLSAQALIEFYVTDKVQDPTNSLGILDARTPDAVRAMADYMWVNWFNLPGAAEGINTLSFGFTPHDLQTVVGAGGVGGTKNAFYNELQGVMVDMYAWLGTYGAGDPNWHLSDGTSFFDAYDTIQKGNFAAPNVGCGNSNWKCAQWPDGQWLHFWGFNTGSPKQLGQAYMWDLPNGLLWRLGYQPWYVDDITDSRNPCRDGSNGGNPCAPGHTSPFADKVPGYIFQVRATAPGSDRYSSYPYEQLDPTDCPNGGCDVNTVATGAFPAGTNVSIPVGSSNGFRAGSQLTVDTGSNKDVTTVVSASAGHVVAASLGRSHASGVPVEGNDFLFDRASAIFNITSTGFQVTGMSYESLNSASFNYSIDPDTTCAQGSITTQDLGFPFNKALTSIPTWVYQWTVTGIPPGSKVHGNFTTVDKSGNSTTTNCLTTPGNYAGGGLFVTTLTPTQLGITTASLLPTATIDIPYTTSISAAGGHPPYTWAVVSGGLPFGLTGATVNNQFVISGTPAHGDFGTYSFTVQVSDAQDAPVQQVFQLTVNTLQDDSAPLPAAIVNQPYNCGSCLHASGGTQPFTWSPRIGILPQGLQLVQNSPQGQIIGTPTVCGNFNITWQVKDSSVPPQTATKLNPLIVSGCGNQVIVNTTTLPDGTIGSPYSSALSASGGTGGPYSWSVLSGALPDGLSLAPNTGGSLTYTTSLSAETSNNTSASLLFTGQTNGNEAPVNISKLDTHTLLYSGNTTYTYAHLLPWFCTTNGQGNPCNGHVYVGYNSNDATQAQKQVTDMISRGLNGLVIDYYGKPFGTVTSSCPQGTSHCIEDQASQKVMNYVASLPAGFTMHLMEDYGAFSGRCQGTAWSGNGYASQQACVIALLEADMTWMSQTFWGRTGYLKVGGKPVVGTFPNEGDSGWTAVNWTTVWTTVQSFAAALPNSGGGPIFYFENNSGFTHTASGGAFAWVQINGSDRNDWAQSYLDSFYTLGKTKPAEITFGGAWAGFNDSLASWGSGRIMNQNCGQTLLHTVGEPGSFYSTGTQLPYLEFVTWNDYDEGSELETGIDPCSVVSNVSVSGSTLSWSYTGASSTIDHFTVYITGQTGSNPQLAVLQDNIPVAQTSLNLGPLTSSLTSGTYALYVKMTSKPMMKNNVSASPAQVVVSSNGCSSNCAGQIVGTPTAAGVFPFTIQAQDPSGNQGVAQLSITVASIGVMIAPITLADGMPQFPYLDQFRASGGDGNYTWSLATGSDPLPNGLTLHAGTGVLDGTPTTPGSANLIIQVTDGHGSTDTLNVPLTIETGVAISSPVSGPLTAGTVGTGYTVTFTVIGGTSPYSCTVTSGSVPGLSMNSNTCILSGIPTQAGTFNFTVRANDSNGFYTIPDVSYSVTMGSGTVQPAAIVRGGTVGRGQLVGR